MVWCPRVGTLLGVVSCVSAWRWERILDRPQEGHRSCRQGKGVCSRSSLARGLALRQAPLRRAYPPSPILRPVPLVGAL